MARFILVLYVFLCVCLIACAEEIIDVSFDGDVSVASASGVAPDGNVTYSFGFPLKGNWWDLVGFGFGEVNSAFAGYHLGVDSKPAKTPFNTPVYSPCNGRVKVSDNLTFGGYGSDSAGNSAYRGYVLVIACVDEIEEPYVILLGHLQRGSSDYSEKASTGLAPLDSLVKQGQYVGRIAHYWHGAGTATDWPHLHFGVYRGVFDAAEVSHYVSGYSASGWNTNHSVHASWLEPTRFIREHSEYAQWHPDGSLLQVYGDSAIYLVRNGQLAHVADERVFNGYGYDWTRVTFISEEEFSCYEVASDISSVPTRRLYVNQGNYYAYELTCPNCRCEWWHFASEATVWSFGYYPGNAEVITLADVFRWQETCEVKHWRYWRDGMMVKPPPELGYGAGAIFVSQSNGLLSAFVSERSWAWLGLDYSQILSVSEADFQSSYRALGPVIGEELLTGCWDGELEKVDDDIESFVDGPGDSLEPPLTASGINCSIVCPSGYSAYVWYGDSGYKTSPTSLEITFSYPSLCERGQAWVDYNCATSDWSKFDYQLATINCDRPFVTERGRIDSRGEGEVWFPGINCF